MRTIRTLLYLLAAVPLAAVALAVLIVGWVLVACLAITPLVVPALVAFRSVVGGVARFEAELANELLGTSVRPPLSSPGPAGFWRRGGNVLDDGVFWRQQAYLVARLSLVFAAAVAEWSLLAASLGLVTMPIWYRWSDVRLGDNRQIGSVGRAFLCVPLGIAGLAIALALTRPLAFWARYAVEGLLGGAGVPVESPTVTRGRRRQRLAVHALVCACVIIPLIVIWAVTSRGYFWPEWILLMLAVPLAVHAWVELVDDRPRRVPRGFAIHLGVSTVLALFFTLVWALTTHGYFWPVWPILVLVVSLLVHAAVVFQGRGVQDRIAVLEETRAGAVDLQDSELRRIERDLHDGAQARLVALGMSLGMAEQKLASDPAAARELLAEARRGTHEALEELRSLARGIHPPVLSDRGLEAAISALAEHTPLKVNVTVDIPRRPPGVIETAAYFVVAEALANTGKHAAAGRVDIGVRYEDGALAVEVADDGSGGADRSGSGLRGLARRVEALDGRLEVVSPTGGPTTIRAVIPCVL